MTTPPAKTSLLIRGAVPIVFQRELAHAIGLNQAIVLQELAYLFDKTKSGKVIDGERWIYNTYEEWQENFFPFFSVGTLTRIVQDLEKRGLLLSCQPEGGISRRKYYRLGEGAISKLTLEMYGEQQRLSKIADEEPNLADEGRNLRDSGRKQNESFDDANCVLPITEGSTEGSTNTPIVPLKGTKKGPLQLRAEAIFHRKPESPLTPSERRAFKNSKAAIEATSDDDWILLERFYAAPQQETFARKDLATLVNNWNGEIDRARAYGPAAKPEKQREARF